MATVLMGVIEKRHGQNRDQFENSECLKYITGKAAFPFSFFE
jgi:hypothetical protein